MLSRLFRIALFVSVFFLALCFAPGAEIRAQGPTNPDFSLVDDMLQGRRKLFPSDDLIVTVNDNSGGVTSVNLLQTSNDAVNAQYANDINNNPTSAYFLSVSARLFNLPRDVVVTLLPGETVLYDQAGSVNQSFNNTLSAFQAQTGVTVNDFTGDGYADVAYIDFASATETTVNIMTAVDVNDLSQGFFYGTPFTLPNDVAALVGASAVASGDFDGDGANEVAVAYQNLGTYVAIFRPQVTTDNNGTVTGITLQEIGSTTAGAFPTDWLVLNAGRFNGLANATLVLSYQIPGSGSDNEVALQPISVAATANPNQVTLTLPNGGIAIAQDAEIFTAANGYLDFFDTTEQLVLLVQGNSAGNLDIVTFDNDLNPTLANSLSVANAGFQGGNGTILGVALGNFDQPNTDDNPVTLEIALALPNQPAACSGNYSALLQMYHVDVSNYAITAANSAQLQSCFQSIYSSLGLVTGDTQGRSLVLGVPTTLVAQHQQAQVVLEAPPMHLDFITPNDGTKPIVFNVSAVPEGFYSSYSTQVSNQAQSSNQGTTSYANAVKTSDSVGFKFGDPLVGSVSVNVNVSAGWMRKKFITKQYGEYSSTSFDASTDTGFDDQVWFNAQTHNIYFYPVLGHTVCPAEIPNCAPNQEEPLILSFSGPTIQSQQSIGGGNLEWYQPVHEIGNLFSYPWTLAQLEAAQGGIALLTSSDPTTFYTDGSTYTASANWKNQNSSSVTSGSVSNVEWGASASVTEKASIFGGITGSQKFSYNGSKSISALHTQTTKLGQSTGIGIVKPGTFPNPDLYEYPILPFIFGNNPLSTTVQTVNLDTTVQTNGTLHAGFVTNPANGGAWWQGLGQYTLPDVAVSHPARWDLLNQPTPSNPPPLNCLQINATTQRYNCAYFNQPETDVWTSESYWMKGLLITPADANGQGPQITQAVAGDVINLSARVFNYSLADMPQGSEIVVQFYGQPWNQTTKEPAGDAFLIDAVNAPPLYGFDSPNANDVSNWQVVSTTFDTANYADQFIGFWIVVYATEGGSPVPELPAHGLTGIPTSLAEAQQFQETYSNNVGFYKSLFYVAPQISNTVPFLTKSDIRVAQVKVSSSRVLLGDHVIVSGRVSSQQGADGVSVLFSDGTSKRKGRVFDIDNIAHIRANGTDLAKTVYLAAACGTHTLYVRVADTNAFGQANVTVTINPRKSVVQLRRLAKQVDLNQWSQGNAATRLLKQAGNAFKNNDTAAGLDALKKFREMVRTLRQDVAAPQADMMLAILDQVFTCVR